MEPIDKLDYVLAYLQKAGETQAWSAEGVAIGLNPEGKAMMTAGEAWMIIDKLVRDGYVVERTVRSEKVPTISFEGSLFHGYKVQKEIDDIYLAIAETDLRVRIRNEGLLVQGTWFVGIAAILIFLWQVFIYLYPVHANYPYFFWHK